MVILLPDGGRGYLGKIFNDKWMRSYGFLPASEDRTVADMVGTKNPDLAGLVHVHPSDTVRHAIDKMREFDISQMPVLTAEPPVVMGEVVGSIDERTLIDAVFGGRAQLTDALAEFVEPAARSDRHARLGRGRARCAHPVGRPARDRTTASPPRSSPGTTCSPS